MTYPCRACPKMTLISSWNHDLLDDEQLVLESRKKDVQCEAEIEKDQLLRFIDLLKVLKYSLIDTYIKTFERKQKNDMHESF